MIRLQKFLAHAGVGSLRACEAWIQEGLVTVNGIVIREMGVQIDPEVDVVTFRGRVVQQKEPSVTVMLNKPEGYITTAKDQFGRPCVTDLIHEKGLRLYPVGRLDYQTSGLLLLTNDGNLTYGLTHPSHHIPKIYQALVKGLLTEDQAERLRQGVTLDDGYTTLPAEVRILSKSHAGSLIEMTIYEGKNHEVRRMAQAVHHPVLKLKRTGLAFLTLGGLREGHYRKLSEEEISKLKQTIKNQ